jgi:two-component system chemotaxis sensor kinase CheA
MRLFPFGDLMSAHAEELPAEIPLSLDPALDAEFVAEFINDAREQLENIERSTLELEKNGSSKEIIHTLFRAFHTFKGNAAFLDLAAISQLAHVVESLLDGVRENRLQLNPAITGIILKSQDTLRQYVDEIEAQITGKKPRQTVHLPTAALKAAAQNLIQGGELLTVAENAARPCSNCNEPNTGEIRADRSATDSTDETIEAALQAVKVPTSKLDGLVDLAGELLIAQSLIAQSIASPGTDRHALSRNLDQLKRISRELQRTAMSMRMVPIRSTFQKMHRLVRDIATTQKKKVDLILEGEETEIDRSIVEKISDPLMHMVRNAVDHAIELPEDRTAAGKSPAGTIRMRAYYKSGNVVIEIEDDGMGLNRERILEKAVRNGLLKAGTKPDDKELIQLILQPGFSTAAVVTDISGRGVGLDVVQKNIGKLRGKIDINSVAGQGTLFLIRLPLTLAIIDGLVIGVGGQRYILPTLSVCESFHPKSGAITELPGGDEVVQLRKEVIPLLRLRLHFGLKGELDPVGDGIMVVVESEGKKRCLLADELIGKQEVVIKNLGEVLKTDPMVSGGAILGDGCIGLILDAAALVDLETEKNPLKLAFQTT